MQPIQSLFFLIFFWTLLLLWIWWYIFLCKGSWKAYYEIIAGYDCALNISPYFKYKFFFPWIMLSSIPDMKSPTFCVQIGLFHFNPMKSPILLDAYQHYHVSNFFLFMLRCRTFFTRCSFTGCILQNGPWWQGLYLSCKYSPYLC